MRSMSRNLVGKTISDVFATGYCAAIESIKNYSFLVVKSVITEMIHRELPKEMPNQTFNRWLRSDTFTQIVFEKIANDPGFIEAIAAFIRQHVINAVGEGLMHYPNVTKEILSLQAHLPTFSAEATSNGKSSVPDDNHRHACRRRSPSDADSSLKTSKYR